MKSLYQMLFMVPLPLAFWLTASPAICPPQSPQQISRIDLQTWPSLLEMAKQMLMYVYT